MFYRPKGKAVAADVIPFYKDGIFYLFYLKDFRDAEKYGEGVPWYLIKTKDFVNFEDCGEVLARGTDEQQDLFVFTGSVIEHEGKYYLFYTGHNPHLREKGKPEQAVMLAVGEDCEHFQKPNYSFLLPRTMKCTIGEIRFSIKTGIVSKCFLRHGKRRDLF